MLRIRIRTRASEWILTLFFWLLVLQNPLESVASIFSYIDECLALLGVVLLLYNVFANRQLKIKKTYAKIMLALLVFVLAGLLGNYIYKYQNTTSVLIDLFTCLKFFLCIVVGYEMIRWFGTESVTSVFLNSAKLWSAVLFALLIVDLVFKVFPDLGTRYGFRVVKLFYFHPTYLAGAVVFLLASLTVFHQHKNNLYIILSLSVLFFTLRGKALAGVAIYGLVFFFILYQRKKIKLWHILLIGVVALLVAWEQFSFYYIDLEGQSARSLMTQVSVQIAKDYFPIGTGFGTFASSEAAKSYSQLYYLYGLSTVHGLTPGNMVFGSDTFWPIIIGQTGLIGTIAYVYVLALLGLQVLKLREAGISIYSGGIFLFAYLMISSTSEPTFCNVVSIPIAIVIGILFAFLDKHTSEKKL